MPRTKPQPKPTPLPPTAANGETQLGQILTLPEAAAYLRVSEADILRGIREQGLPARQLGEEWRFSKAAIEDWLNTSPPSALQANKEAWLALAGIWKDDPDLEKIVEEAYRRRGRPITEDGSYQNFSR